MGREATVNLPFQIRTTGGPSGFWFCTDPSLSASGHYRSEALARKSLRNAIADVVEDAIERGARSRTLVGNGRDVWLVEWRHGSWGYSSAGPDAKRRGSGLGYATQEDALADVRDVATFDQQGNRTRQLWEQSI